VQIAGRGRLLGVAPRSLRWLTRELVQCSTTSFTRTVNRCVAGVGSAGPRAIETLLFLLGTLSTGCLLPDVRFEPKGSLPDAGVAIRPVRSSDAPDAGAVTGNVSEGAALASDAGACPGLEGLGSCVPVPVPREQQTPAETPATPESCSDGITNQAETGVDCGGSCPKCAPGVACASSSDCQSAVCDASGCAPGVGRCCQAPSCIDGVANGSEPVPDCGNAACGSCAVDSECSADGQCATGFCQAGVCLEKPSCFDLRQDGRETGLDCGSSDPACARCPLGAGCESDTDCASGRCTGRVCTDCGDGVRNGNETGIDCGGSCGPCAVGIDCLGDSDCASGACQAGRCCGGVAVDCTRCARRLATGIDCSIDTTGAAAGCNAFLQCLADNTEACPTRLAPGCSEAGGPCDTANFGGNGSPGVTLADTIIGTASCSF
jgi:hypothetical protein